MSAVAMASDRAARRVLFGASALLAAGSATLTAVWCVSMSEMGGMAMPGGWTMSMTWMRLPGQTWPGAAASFMAMWLVMMVAMMLPSLAPMLWRYRLAAGRGAAAASARGEGPRQPGGPRIGRLTALVALGYFFVWSLFGLAVFPVGVALAAAAMQQPELARAVPGATGVVVLLAGVLQFTAWKARHLACCRETPGHRALAVDAGTAWRHGVQLGRHCCHCCGGLMAILLAGGVMDLGVMAVVTGAISAERLLPGAARVARALGAVLVAAGLLLVARAARYG